MDVYTGHYNPNLWGPKNLVLLISERDILKRHPTSYLAFDIALQNCVGKRFALMDLKMCLVCLVHRCTILPHDQLKKCMSRQESILVTPQTVYVKLENLSN